MVFLSSSISFAWIKHLSGALHDHLPTCVGCVCGLTTEGQWFTWQMEKRRRSEKIIRKKKQKEIILREILWKLKVNIPQNNKEQYRRIVSSLDFDYYKCFSFVVAVCYNVSLSLARPLIRLLMLLLSPSLFSCSYAVY